MRGQRLLRALTGAKRNVAPPPTIAARPAKQRAAGRFLDVLACPRCRARSLAVEGEAVLLCSSCNYRYDVIDGVPVLLAERQPVKVMPADHQSNAVSSEVRSWLASVDGYSLNLGGGATDLGVPRCVELEYSIFASTDVVGDAHRLPFADSVFDAALCLNTFEHLGDPPVAAAELLRVLKPGGRLLLQTAFLQPVHEEPYHFYNTTEFGLRRWFEGFTIERCSVPGNMSPSMALAWLSEELLHYVAIHCGSDVSERLANSTLADWRRLWADVEARRGFLWDVVESLPDDVRSRFSAGFQLDAVKPEA